MSHTIQMQVYSRSTQDQIDGKEAPPSSDSLEYLPWGTRSLKLKISGDFDGPCYIYPKEFKPGESPVAGYADGLPGGDIQVSWGGGWEEGFRLEDKKKGEEIYIYFNITHRGARAAASYPLTLEAYHGKRPTKLGELCVTLQCPPKLPKGALQPQWSTSANGDKELRLIPAEPGQTASVPFYLSRWWPVEKIDYTHTAMFTPPKMRLLCRRNIGKGYSKVEIFATPAAGGEEQLLAFIDGDIQFPLVDLEQISANLYFMSGHWALRVWFAWLEKSVMGKVDTTGLGKAEMNILKRWRSEQEIPDAERVDIVFDDALNIRYVCTDLHWRELWAPFSGALPLRASIAAEQAKDVLLRGKEGLLAVAAARLKKYAPQPNQALDPAEEVKKQLSKQEEGAEKGAGEMSHKHTPYFHDTGFDLDLISNDVLRG